MENYRQSSQRQLLLKLISEVNGHIDAKELYRRANAQDNSVSTATVYRSLNLFKELGIVDERSLGQGHYCYEVSGKPDHCHVVCQGCGKIVEFETPLVNQLVEAAQREHGFNITKTELYLKGYCPWCERERELSLRH